jgi:N-acetylglucosaminyldiphosphoundecaprenol N-acetyl-beta-D-mannosaminyltransferase
MPPTAAALTVPARIGANGADSASTNSSALWFGSIPITETSAFPPARSPHCWVYVTLNAEIALSMPGNRVLRELVRSARARVSIDGQWLWWALRRKYPGRPLAKLSGSDLIYTLARQCEGHERRLLLLGSTPEINALSVVRLRSLYPKLCVAGFAPPSFQPGGAGEQEVTSAMVEAIESFRPDYVVLGLGAAKEQRVAAQLAPLLDGRVAGLLCFGGAIDMASGRVRRAPVWMQRSGLEGLYRVWQQPARLLRLLLVLRVLPLLAGGRY